MGAKNCLRGAKFFKLGPRHFSRGWKKFHGVSPACAPHGYGPDSTRQEHRKNAQ